MNTGIKSVGGGDSEFSKPGIYNFFSFSPIASPSSPSTHQQMVTIDDGKDTLQSLFGLIKWAVDLISFLTDDLFDLLHTLQKSHPTAETLLSTTNALIQGHSNPNMALPLILSSIPRAVLKHTIRAILLLCAAAQKGIQMAHDPEQRLTLRTVVEIIDGRNVAVKLSVFENFLKMIEGVVSRSYQLTSSLSANSSSSNATTKENNGDNSAGNEGAANQQLKDTSEKTLLITSRIPPALLPALQIIVRDLIPALKRKVEDPAKVYFGEYGHLGLSDPVNTGKGGKGKKGGVVVDVMRRVTFPREAVEGLDDGHDDSGKGEDDRRRRRDKKGIHWRTCTRCDAGMEDLLPPMKGMF